MIRATTGGVLKSYRANLMNSFIGMNKAQNTVLSQRNFNSYAEDPAAAAKAFRLRKSRMAVESQYDICNSAISKYQSAFTCLDTIDKLIDTANGEPMSTLTSTTLEMLNDPKGDARTQLAKVLDQLSETIVQNLNQKYGDNFIFAGADGHNVPFEMKDGQLYYRGVSVDASEPNLMRDANGDPIPSPDGNGYTLASALTIKVQEFEPDPNNAGQSLAVNTKLPDGTTSPTSINVLKGAVPLTQAQYDALSDDDKLDYAEVVDNNGNTAFYKSSDLASEADYNANVAANALVDPNTGDPYVVNIDGQDYYIHDQPENYISEANFEAAKKEADKLAYLVNEKQFVDIGLGFQENENGNLIESSAFDVALNGLTFMGYGLDDDGDPKNIYSLVQQMKELAQNVPEEGDWSNELYEKFRGLVLKLEDASSKFKTEYTNLTASTTKLENNLKLLEENHYTLQMQYSDLEDVDMADAITSFIWAQYCYNAALKVGNSILSQSLMDYLS